MTNTAVQMPGTSLGGIITSYGIPLRSFAIAVVIALSLTLINQWGVFIGVRPLNPIQLVLSFATPFAVIALSQALAIRRVFTELASGQVKTRDDGRFLNTAVGHGIPARAIAISLAAGTIVTLIIIAVTLFRGGGLDQISLSQIGQVYALPLMFSVLSQSIAYRRGRARAYARMVDGPETGAGQAPPALQPENPMLAAAQNATFVKYVRPVTPVAATGLVGEIYAQIVRDFGMVVGPLALHSPSPRLLAAAWMRSRETTIASVVPRAWKEVVAVTVSSLNRCSYCVDAHVTILDALGASDLADAAAGDSLGQAGDSALRSLVEWAAATRTPGAPVLDNPPFTRAEAPEIIGTALNFHYINRMVEIFLGDSPIPMSEPDQKRAMQRSVGQAVSAVLERPMNPGDGLAFLAPAVGNSGLDWAEPSETVHQAHGRAAAAVEELGAGILSAAARRRFAEFIAAWEGGDPDISRNWVEGEVASLDGADKAQARFLLLAGVAPHQIDDGVVAEFRTFLPEDSALVEAAAWASAGAAARIGSWLTAPGAGGFRGTPR